MSVVVNIITSICFILLTGAVAYVIFSYFFDKKSRKERIEFIRGFKKGKCFAVLLIAVPLFYIGYVYKGVGVIGSFFNAVSHLVDLVVLKFGLDKVQGLLDKNIFYRITVYYCCVLVTINALLFAISLFSQRVWHFFKLLGFRFSKKDKLYIFGYNKNSVEIYKSNNGGKAVIIDSLSKEARADLYIGKINYLSVDDNRRIIEKIVNILKKKNSRNKITVVVNTDDDEKNLELCRWFSEILKNDNDAKGGKNKVKAENQDIKQDKVEDKAKTEINYDDVLYDRIAIYFFCDPRYEAICDEIVNSSFGCIHYKNKYQMIAMNFIERYPFASFMNDNHIDYNTALVKDDVNVNVCMIGFGKTNRQIFLTSVANNQFLTKSDKSADGVELKQVNYYIFDKESAENNKNLNHSYYRYRNEFLGEKNEKDKCVCENRKRCGHLEVAGQDKTADINSAIINKDDYLPLPQLPAKEQYFHLDINDNKFYNEIRQAIGNSKDINFAIIAFNTDLENIDMAHKLIEKKSEWGIDNLIIFVKARKSYSDDKIFKEKDAILIGNEKEDVYNIQEITNDAIYAMAKMRNVVYDLEYDVTHKYIDPNDKLSVGKREKQSNYDWFINKSKWERDSSMYCCLSLKSKLNLMGLDYCKDNADNENLHKMDDQEYLEYYAKDDMPDIDTYKEKLQDKKIVNYTLDFPSSKRKNLAILEHLRWNSFMISRGFIPSSKEQIVKEEKNGKDYKLRRHGNLTTFEGLTEFRRMVAKKKHTDELTEDVIKYDYQILDDAYWLLDKNGYKIIKKQ